MHMIQLHCVGRGPRGGPVPVLLRAAHGPARAGRLRPPAARVDAGGAPPLPRPHPPGDPPVRPGPAPLRMIVRAHRNKTVL